MPDVIVALIVAAILALGLWLALGAVLGRPRGRWRMAVWVAAVGVVALVLSASLAFFVSRSVGFQLLGDHVARVETSERVVALTFDDGPTAAYTEEVVRVLRDHDVRATFFVTGGECQTSPAELRRLAVAGHEIGNHSYSHPRLLAMSQDAIAKEIETTDALIRAAGYRGEILFRPPNGKRLVAAPYYLWRHGRTSVTWDVAPDSVLPPDANARELADIALAEVKPGSIVLMHVMYDSRDASRAAVPLIIDGLRARGYRFVTLGELLAMR